MRNLWTLLLVVAACGGDDKTDVTPDAPPDQPDVSFTPHCDDPTPQTGPDAFSKAADFGGPILTGSLTAWDANGRWFLTGTRVGGVSSFHVEKRDGGVAIVDRDTETPGTIDGDALFQRQTFDDGQGNTVIIAKKV